MHVCTVCTYNTVGAHNGNINTDDSCVGSRGSRGGCRLAILFVCIRRLIWMELDFGICGCRLRMQLLLYVPANKKRKWKKKRRNTTRETWAPQNGDHNHLDCCVDVYSPPPSHHHYSSSSSSSQENGERNPRCVEFLFFFVFFLFPIWYYYCVITLDNISYLMAGNSSLCRNATNWLW